MTPWQQNMALRHLSDSVGPDDAMRITREVLFSELQGTPTMAISIEHVQAWRAALAEGRRAPALRPGSALAASVQAGPVDLSWRPPASLEILLPEEWPEVLWYYPSPAERIQQSARGALVPMSRQSHAGTIGIEALSVPPQSLASWAATAGLPARAGALPSMRLNLHELRKRVNMLGDTEFHVLRVRDQTGVTYLVRPVKYGFDDSVTLLVNGEFALPPGAPSAAAGSASASAGATPAVPGPSRWSGVSGLPRMQRPR
jgi:hypothetical protein